MPSLDQVRAEKARREGRRELAELDQRADAVRERCRSFHGFVREAWHVLEPAQPFVDGWHVGALTGHYEAVHNGRINRLLANVPPGTSKSLLYSVMGPAWEWGPMGCPDLRFLTTSYSEAYAKRDSRRMRDLVSSEWYQRLWPDVKLTRVAEMSFGNTAGGFREAVPFARLTGGRGDRVIIDDPHSTEQAESEAERKRAIRIFRESVPSRLNDPIRSAIIAIMQRLHAGDVSGVALSQGLGYTHLMLPMEFEIDRRCETEIGFRDPRTYEGELLCPERWPPEVIERDRAVMGSYAWAGQMQQRPAPREGGMFKIERLGIVSAAPAGIVWCRGWDLAASKDQGSWTVGAKIGRAPSGLFFVEDVVRLRGSAGEVESAILNTAARDGAEPLVSLPQDPGQAGKAQAQYLVSRLAGYRVKATPETGDKATRAEPYAAQVEAGNVALVRGKWNEVYLEELGLFPGGEHNDQVDASSRAFTEIVRSNSGPRVF